MKFSNGDKFVDFGTRTIVNSEHAGMLLKNMPVDDAARYGRLKDHMSVLIDAVESDILGLEVSLGLDRHRQNMVAQIIENNDAQLDEIKNMIAARDGKTLNIVKEVIVHVEQSLFSLGLEEDQEKRLMAMLESGVDQIEKLPDFAVEIEFSYAHARESLSNLLNPGLKS